MKTAGDKRQSEQHKKAMLAALEKSLGIVTTACKATGVTRGIYYGWLKRDKDFAAQVDEMQEIALDFAESKLHKKIEQGSDTAIIFYLKTKGKARGYVERMENVNIDNPSFVVQDTQKGVMKVLKHIDGENKKTG